MNANTKICRKCKTEKSISEFVKSQLVRKNGKCKSCQKENRQKYKEHISEYGKKYYQENKEQLDIQHKNYYQENKDHLLECQKLYLQENEDAKIAKKEYNKEYHKTYDKEYLKVRAQNDPAFRLRTIVSASIRAAIKRANSKKKGSCLQHLLYSIQELKEHLEAQFELWMTWDNQGKYDPKTWDDNNPLTWKWNIDHIVPQSDLPYSSMNDDNFQKCWALENLRPYSAKQNILDGTMRIRHQTKILEKLSS